MNKICIVCGNQFNESHQNVLCCSQKCGQEFRQTNFDNILRRYIGEPISDWLKRHYTINHWTYKQICNALHINTRTLMRYMKEYNIPITTPSESVKLQWVRNPDRKLNSRNVITKGAIKRANTFRNNPQKAESNLIKELDNRNINYKFQYPVDSYILDFAFPELMLDIELDNPKRCGKTLDRLEKTRSRIKELSSKGWRVIQYSTTKDAILIADEIETLLNHS
jgi:very-short-patch-repair endonuclease